MDSAVLDYWVVERPGRLRRSWETGDPLRERITVREFLRRTDVLDHFARRAQTGIEAVQAAVINPWGFVGFQFGEPLLIDLEYYRPAVVSAVIAGEAIELPSYYAGPETMPETWRHGRRSFLSSSGDSRTNWREATDVNTWRGTFTGKDGVRSLADLRRPGAQFAILRRSLRHSMAILSEQEGSPFRDPWDGSRGGPPLAGLLAASHLCGPYAVAEYLSSGALRADEAGTSIATYLDEFADIPLAPEDIYGGAPTSSRRGGIAWS